MVNEFMSDKDILINLKTILNVYLGSVNEAKLVFIATLDGHLLLERSKDNKPLDQVAPMAGSLLGIAETLSSQLLNNKLEDNIIMMNDEVLGLFKVQDKEDSLFIGVLCEKMVSLGKLITFAKQSIKSINSAIENEATL